MDEITIKVSNEYADHILEALKYCAVYSTGFIHETAMEVYHNVKRQIENQ